MSGYGSWGCSLSQRILRMFHLTLAPKDVKPLEDVSYIILAPVSIFFTLCWEKILNGCGVDINSMHSASQTAGLHDAQFSINIPLMVPLSYYIRYTIQ